MLFYCWVFGDDPEHHFPVEIEATKSVSALKKAIKKEKTHGLQHVEADSLGLYPVSIPFGDSFREKLGNFRPHQNYRLPDTTLNCFFWKKPADDCLNIVVRVPGYYEPYHTFKLNCLVLNGEDRSIFMITIKAVQTVESLMDAIKDITDYAINRHMPAHCLDLWKVSLNIDKHIDKNSIAIPSESPLLAIKKLSDVFLEYPDQDHLHIVAKVPTIHSVVDKYRSDSSSAYIFSTEAVRTLRTLFLKRSPFTNPDLEEFIERRQKNLDKMLYCNRPREASETIPVTLLHPIFGQFIDDCENYKPTSEDNAFVLDLSKDMLKIYPDEEKQENQIIHSFNSYGISLARTEDIDYWADKYINHGIFQFALIDAGSERMEPFIKSLLYYLEWTRSRAPEMPNSVLPFIIINVFGPHMSISGAAWNLRPAIQVLSPTLPFHFHISDTKMRAMVARCLGSLKKAIRSLHNYYSSELPAMDTSIPPSYPSLDAYQMFPYPKHFTSLVDSTKQDFEYVKQYKDRYLIFFGKLLDGYDICIKLTRWYSPEVHSFCASKGFAPKLLGCEMIPGGWWMVVMERIDESHEELCVSSRKCSIPVLDKLKEFLICLHEEGFVHGDIRGTNTMIPRNGEDDFLLIDFDWAGIIGEVRYPINVNRCYELWRPDGARDGELIIPEHDDEMLEHMFSLYSYTYY